MTTALIESNHLQQGLRKKHVESNRRTVPLRRPSIILLLPSQPLQWPVVKCIIDGQCISSLNHARRTVQRPCSFAALVITDGPERIKISCCISPSLLAFAVDSKFLTKLDQVPGGPTSGYIPSFQIDTFLVLQPTLIDGLLDPLTALSAYSFQDPCLRRFFVLHKHSISASSLRSSPNNSSGYLSLTFVYSSTFMFDV